MNAGGLRAGGTARPYFFHMDAVRALLMLLGVPYHVARVYGGGRYNAVASPESNRLLDVFADVSHSFRMEAFFVVAGFFACMVMMRGNGGFLRGRLVRIGVPLLVCTALFGPPGAMLLSAGLNHGRYPDGDRLAGMLVQPGSWWVMHLWFLHTLLLLSLVLAALGWAIARWPVAARVAAEASRRLSAWLARPFVVAAAGIVLAWLAVWVVPAVIRRATGVALHPLGPFFDLVPVVHFVPMFLFGAAMWVKPELLAWMTRPQRAALPLALAGSTIFVIGSQEGPLEGVLVPIGACMAGLFWSQLLISGAARHFDRPSALVRYLSAASFTVYLFHMPIVLWLGLVLLPVHWPPIAEFVVIVVLTLALCIGIHEVIRRSGLLAFLFNGKAMPARRSVVSGA